MKYFLIPIAILLVVFLPKEPIEYVNKNPIKMEVLAQERDLPKIRSEKHIEVNLTNNEISLWKGEVIIDTLPIAYQAKVGNWFQSPTGYFKVGIMRKDFKSSLTGVNMPYSIQIYEDFFIHEIPFLEDGTKLTSTYSGGCLRLETEDAKILFDFTEQNMPVVIYTTFDGMILKPEYHAPVDLTTSWIRQRFNNPIKISHKHGSDIDNIKYDYEQHTGMDFAGEGPVYSIADGTIAGIWKNGNAHGLGNIIVINHGEFYALYGHLKKVVPFKIGDKVKKGQVLADVGNTGYGCNYWRIGEDGCDSENLPDNHLHFEIKTKPVLENPAGKGIFYGYTLDLPTKYGYFNPMEVLFYRP